jgi:dCMP deaminase
MKNVTTEFPVDPDEVISRSELDRMFLASSEQEAERSPDWWRQVGASVVKDDICITLSNTHTPSIYTAYIDGDPRTPFGPGERIDVSLSEHAEARIVSYFARTSLSMDGAKVYVTTFPCPTCARLLVSAGVKEIYYSGGYSLVNAREVFRSVGVKVVRVKM